MDASKKRTTAFWFFSGPDDLSNHVDIIFATTFHEHEQLCGEHRFDFQTLNIFLATRAAAGNGRKIFQVGTWMNNRSPLFPLEPPRETEDQKTCRTTWIAEEKKYIYRAEDTAASGLFGRTKLIFGFENKLQDFRWILLSWTFVAGCALHAGFDEAAKYHGSSDTSIKDRFPFVGEAHVFKGGKAGPNQTRAAGSAIALAPGLSLFSAHGFHPRTPSSTGRLKLAFARFPQVGSRKLFIFGLEQVAGRNLRRPVVLEESLLSTIFPSGQGRLTSRAFEASMVGETVRDLWFPDLFFQDYDRARTTYGVLRDYQVEFLRPRLDLQAQIDAIDQSDKFPEATYARVLATLEEDAGYTQLRDSWLASVRKAVSVDLALATHPVSRCLPPVELEPSGAATPLPGGAKLSPEHLVMVSHGTSWKEEEGERKLNHVHLVSTEKVPLRSPFPLGIEGDAFVSTFETLSEDEYLCQGDSAAGIFRTDLPEAALIAMVAEPAEDLPYNIDPSENSCVRSFYAVDLRWGVIRQLIEATRRFACEAYLREDFDWPDDGSCGDEQCVLPDGSEYSPESWCKNLLGRNNP